MQTKQNSFFVNLTSRIFTAIIFGLFGVHVVNASSFVPTPTTQWKSLAEIVTPNTSSFPMGGYNRVYSAQINVQSKSINDSLSLTLNGLPKGLSLAKCAPYKYGGYSKLGCKIQGSSEESGVFPIEIIVNDGKGFTTHRTFNLILENTVNVAPAFDMSTIPSTTSVGDYYEATFRAYDIDTYDSVNMSFTGLPKGINVGCAKFISYYRSRVSCAVKGNPSEKGTYYVTSTLSDGVNSVVQRKFLLVVDQKNAPQISSVSPEIAHPGDRIVIKGKLLNNPDGSVPTVYIGSSLNISDYKTQLIVNSDGTELSFRLPDLSEYPRYNAQSYSVSITTSRGTSNNKTLIAIDPTLDSSAPQIYSVSPSRIEQIALHTVAPDTLVTIKGKNFNPDADMNKIYLGNGGLIPQSTYGYYRNDRGEEFLTFQLPRDFYVSAYYIDQPLYVMKSSTGYIAFSNKLNVQVVEPSTGSFMRKWELDDDTPVGTLRFANLGVNNVSKIAYEIVYKTDDGVDQGILGEAFIGGAPNWEKTFIFGTCSASVCTPHIISNSVRVNVALYDMNGNDYKKITFLQ